MAIYAFLGVTVDAFSALSSPPENNHKSQTSTTLGSSRRQFVSQTMGGIMAGISVSFSSKSARASSTARVEQWPGVEYLEPVYEFQLSLQEIAKAAEDESQFASLQQRLERFFKGNIWSERNLYAGIALSYTTQIRYDPYEIREYARLDQEERFNLMENTLDNLQNLYVSLASSSTPGATVNKQDVSDFANGATACMRRWFALIPSSEVERAKELYEATRSGDTNKDGKVDSEELQGVPEGYRALWKKRLEFTGV